MKSFLPSVFLLAALPAGAAPAGGGAAMPNILLVMADDLGWGDVGFNGNPIVKTPHLDRMAENGLRLTRFYTASPLCSPTRGSCLTGRYPWRFGVLAAHTGGMRMAEVTVAEVADNMEGDDSRIIMDRVLPFIRGAAGKQRPFLACVWFHTPHEPVVAGPEFRKLYADQDDLRQNYFGAITAMDEQIGRLRAELRRLGIERNTIVFFTSDNGPADPLVKRGVASAGPFRGHKHTMYEGGLRVPTLVEWPGRVTAGTTSDAMGATVDFFPTVVELTGASLGKKADRPIDGLSMKELLTGVIKERAAPLFFGYRRLMKDIDGQALVANRYKLLKSALPGGGYELYDLVDDPAEKHNLASIKPDVFSAMKARMAEYEESCRRSRDGADYEY